MRTNLELPEALIKDAMKITKIHTKTDVIKTALENLIQRERIKKLADYFGKIDLELDLEAMRNR